jgi:hypothetical protein
MLFIKSPGDCPQRHLVRIFPNAKKIMSVSCASVNCCGLGREFVLIAIQSGLPGMCKSRPGAPGIDAIAERRESMRYPLF